MGCQGDERYSKDLSRPGLKVERVEDDTDLFLLRSEEPQMLYSILYITILLQVVHHTKHTVVGKGGGVGPQPTDTSIRV